MPAMQCMSNEKIKKHSVYPHTGNYVAEDIFNLSNNKAYEIWREQKLKNYPNIVSRIVRIKNFKILSQSERKEIISLCDSANLAIYSGDQNLSREGLIKFSSHFNLSGLDIPIYAGEKGVTEITQVSMGRQGQYAPYSNRSLSWHTDGYYNPPGSEIRCFILHCIGKAKRGGETALLDPEIAYIMLRDKNPAYVRALMQPDIFAIQANIENEKIIRPVQTGPVFSIIDDSLHMRFSARKRYVTWKKDPIITKAKSFLEEILEDRDGPVVRYTLSPGEGVICNNVLHKRTAFQDEDKSPRRLLRARFIARIAKSVK